MLVEVEINYTSGDDILMIFYHPFSINQTF